MSTFQTGDPVVYLGNDTVILRTTGGRLGTVLDENTVRTLVTICDDETGRIYQAPMRDIAYPEGTPLTSAGSGFEPLLAVIPRLETQNNTAGHITVFDLAGIIDHRPTGLLHFTGHRPKTIGKRIFHADAPVVFVGDDTSEQQFHGIAHVVRSHFDGTTVRLDDGELRIVNTFDLSYPERVWFHTETDKLGVRSLPPKRSASTAVHLTHGRMDWEPTDTIIINHLNEMVVPE